jgi:hypothetical protein
MSLHGAKTQKNNTNIIKVSIPRYTYYEVRILQLGGVELNRV